MRLVEADGELVAAMARLGEGLVGCPAEAVVLSPRSDRTVVRFGGVVLKAHEANTDPADLVARLRVAADPRLADVLLSPLRMPSPSPPPSSLLSSSSPLLSLALSRSALSRSHSGLGDGSPGGFVARVRDRLVTAWPAGRALGPDESDRVPWQQAAAALARLHAEPLAPSVPTARVGRRLADVLDRLARLHADSDRSGILGRHVDVVLACYRELPDWAAGREPVPGPGPQRLVHGDWHLGQLVELAGVGWRFVDVDDLGAGDPVWDLARPAAWFAAGLIAPAEWTGFVDAYRQAGGTALPGDGDPWPWVDVPARAMTVQYAAAALLDWAVTGEAMDDAAVAVVECCGRMAPSRHSFGALLGTLPTPSDVRRATGGSR